MTHNRLHSICRWTFHSGKGGFHPGNIRPSWAPEKFTCVDLVRLIDEKIKPRLPSGTELGLELHYDTEIDDKSAAGVADALKSTNIHLAMITPGLHSHFGYGGVASLDSNERERARDLSQRTVDLA